MIWNLAAAMLAGALLRFFRLGAPSLWIDEVLTWYTADIGHPMPLSAILENVHGPLYSVLLHHWGALAGDSEWALRFPSAVLGILTIPIFAWMAARWLGKEAAIPTAWLTAASPFLVWYSQESRNYALLLPLVALSWIGLLEVHDRIRPKVLVGYLLASAAAVLSNFSFMLLAPVHLVMWVSPGPFRRRRITVLVVAVLALSVAVSPWLRGIAATWDWGRLHPKAPASTESLRAGPAMSLAAYPFTLHAFAVGYSLGPSIREIRERGPKAALRAHVPELALVGLLIGLFSVLALRAAHRRRVLLVALLVLGVPTLLLSYGALQNFKPFHPRYVAVSFPFGLALLGAAFADTRLRIRALLGVVLALAWITSLHHHFFRPEYGKEDMRTAAAFVAARSGPGDRIFGAGAEDVLIYYYRGPLPVQRYWLGWSAQPERMESKLEEARAGARNVWIVWSRGEDLDPRGRFLSLIESRYPEAETFRTEGVRVWRIPGTAAGDSLRRE